MSQTPWRPWIRLWLAGLFLAPVPAAGSGKWEASLRGRLAWQIALDRVGLSPGILDGQIGPKTRLATREFQRVRGLPKTGKLDAATAAALVPEPDKAVTTYTVEAGDLAQVGPLPRGWVAKSKVKRLPYPSLTEVLAEKFHCSRGLLARLNPGKSLAGLKPGDAIQVPAVPTSLPPVSGARIDINLAEKTIRVVDKDRRLAGLFHCSIAARRSKRPSGSARVVVISHNPTYRFDPAMWPEVKGVPGKLLLPPGPRNPVGLCWIGLSLPGYGIHGSPAPELIGRTGSHGCFRLANWDALRLSKMVRVGTPVTFTTRRMP